VIGNVLPHNCILHVDQLYETACTDANNCPFLKRLSNAQRVVNTSTLTASNLTKRYIYRCTNINHDHQIFPHQRCRCIATKFTDPINRTKIITSSSQFPLAKFGLPISYCKSSLAGYVKAKLKWRQYCVMITSC
jgi:hypothetical protein